MLHLSTDPLAKTQPMSDNEWRDLLARERRSIKRLQQKPRKQPSAEQHSSSALQWRTAALGVQLPCR